MPILKFYRDGNGYYCNFFTQDKQYMLSRELKEKFATFEKPDDVLDYLGIDAYTISKNGKIFSKMLTAKVNIFGMKNAKSITQKWKTGPRSTSLRRP